MSDSNLSSKIVSFIGEGALPVKDVREFIKRLDDFNKKGVHTPLEWAEEIDSLKGDKL